MRGDRTVSFLLFFVIVVLGVWAAVVISRESRVAAAQNAPQTEAEVWLSWSAEARDSFVHGYLEGFARGKRQACEFYEEKVPTSVPVPVEKLPHRICLDSLPEFTEPYYQAYVDAITSYYKKYQHDRQAGLTEIMSELATPPGVKNIDQIHAKLK